MTSIQPESFDLIVVGTGLEESLIAASAARSGKTVLHLDQADSYGSAWSSLNMDQFLVWADQTSSSTATPPVQEPTGLQESANITAADAAGADLLRVPVTHEQAQTYSNTQLHQQPVALGSSREFSLDLAGKAVFCASDTIETMLSFGVQNYLEFKLLQGSYIYTDGKLASVPASRAAIFRDRTLGPMDKRLLTRFLMQLGNSPQDNIFPQAAPNQPLVTLLRSQGLSLLMRQFIIGAFLTLMYGCAELPQAFCRVAAVHGAVYMLRQPIDSLLLDHKTHHCRGIQTDTGQVVRCSALAGSAAALHNLLRLSQPALLTKQQPASSAPAKRISKAICILDGPIKEGESQLLIIIPPNTPLLQNPHAIRAIQLGPAAAVCPGNRHLLYLSTPSTAATAAEDFWQ
ncbi:hypothetical protein WJX79_002547 [Trebouxia sp. C0005]